MANVEYNISASTVGSAYESTATFQFYYDNCGDSNYLVSSSGGSNTFSKTDIETGITLMIPDEGQILYILPLSEECPLGCDYIYSASLSGYIVPTPTTTPTPTVTSTPGASPTPTPTPTPTTSGPAIPKTYGNVTISITGGYANMKVEWSNSIPVYTRSQYASQLANYLAQTTVSATTNTSVPVEADLAFSFDVYDPDLTTEAYDVNDLVGSKVWWYAGTYGDSGQEKTQVNITGVSIGDVQGYGVVLTGILGFLEE